MELAPNKRRAERNTMSPHIEEVAVLTIAMKDTRIALVNLHNKYPNGLPFVIADALEDDLDMLLGTVERIKEMATQTQIAYATHILKRNGISVNTPCDDLTCGKCAPCESYTAYQNGELR